MIAIIVPIRHSNVESEVIVQENLRICNMFVNQKGPIERQICSVRSSRIVNACIVTAKLIRRLRYGGL